MHNNKNDNKVSRRKLLKSSAHGATLGALLSALGYPAYAAMNDQSVVGSGCLTILYRNGDDVTFDYDYYRDNHLTLIMDRYGRDAISRYEFRKPVSMEGAPPSPYVACVNIWIRDAEKFAAAGAQHGQEVAGDVPNFTNTMLDVQNDIVWGESGADLHSPVMGQTCMTILYPYEAGATWDADYYRDNHMTLIMRLYTTAAISRFEVRKPAPAPAGTTPAFLGTVNFYIADQDAFDAAGAIHTDELVADVPNFSSVFPVVIPTTIYGLDA